MIGALRATALVVPKIINLRRNVRSWFLFRLAIGLLGAAMVILPFGLLNNYVVPIAGLAMFVVAVLVPGARMDKKNDAKPREVAALALVKGGYFFPAGAAAPVEVQLFVGDEQISVLDSRLQPVLAIPVASLLSVRAEGSVSGWVLRVKWDQFTAEFNYTGISAEHLARDAESTFRNVMRPAPPAIPQHRAAGA
jgi:hypothetical protein